MHLLKTLSYVLYASVASPVLAEPWGHFETQYWHWNNRPAYTDNLGPKLLYGIDFQLNVPLLQGGYLNLGVGADSQGSREAFNRAAGRFLVFGQITDSVMWEYKHRSEHNFDHRAEMNPNFFSTDMIILRYTFGVAQTKAWH